MTSLTSGFHIRYRNMSRRLSRYRWISIQLKSLEDADKEIWRRSRLHPLACTFNYKYAKNHLAVLSKHYSSRILCVEPWTHTCIVVKICTKKSEIRKWTIPGVQVCSFIFDNESRQIHHNYAIRLRADKNNLSCDNNPKCGQL